MKQILQSRSDVVIALLLIGAGCLITITLREACGGQLTAAGLLALHLKNEVDHA
ncbi:MAG: hypothetical protein ACRD3D_13115 [Terriglobia bacterium]